MIELILSFHIKYGITQLNLFRIEIKIKLQFEVTIRYNVIIFG